MSVLNQQWTIYLFCNFFAFIYITNNLESTNIDPQIIISYLTLKYLFDNNIMFKFTKCYFPSGVFLKVVEFPEKMGWKYIAIMICITYNINILSTNSSVSSTSQGLTNESSWMDNLTAYPTVCIIYTVWRIHPPVAYLLIQST